MTPKDKPAKRSKQPTRMIKKAGRPKIKAERGDAARIYQNIYAPNQRDAVVAAAH